MLAVIGIVVSILVICVILFNDVIKIVLVPASFLLQVIILNLLSLSFVLKLNNIIYIYAILLSITITAYITWSITGKVFKLLPDKEEISQNSNNPLILLAPFIFLWKLFSEPFKTLPYLLNFIMLYGTAFLSIIITFISLLRIILPQAI
jgi:hypothetical protein